MRVFSCSLLAFLLLAGVSLAAPPERPDMIFIMGDDHPWPAYGFMKDLQDRGTFPTPAQHPSLPPIETPNLDRLAQRGAVFPVGASGDSVCRSSFRVTLTGLYPKDFRDDEREEITMGTYLANAGYIGYGFGKIWQRGFGVLGFTEGGVRSKTLPRRSNAEIWEFIDSRDPDGPPWILFYSPRLPHSPYHVSRPFRSLFPPEMFTDRKGIKSPNRAQRVYANIKLLDFWIGELLDGLQERRIDERTLILMQGSDNGYLLRPSKKRMTEDGFRSSFFVSWPGVIPQRLVLPQMVNAVDVIPTLLDYAGAPVPPYLEGESMQPYIEDPNLPGRAFLFTMKRHQTRRALRTRDGMRFVRNDKSGRIGLYDLTVDPHERNNLADDPAYAHRVAEFQQALDSWF